MTIDWFIFFRNIALLFAILMLIKYFIFLTIAPFYDIKEELRNMRIKKYYSPYNKLFVSVIIPAWNEEIGVTKTINSVIANTYDNFEIIVVNDGSTDNSDIVITNLIKKIKSTNKRWISNIKYFYKKNGGKGSALNYGIKRARGDIIVTIDADSMLDRLAIEKFVHYFGDKKLSAVVGNVRIANKKTIIGLLQKLEYLFGFYYKRTHAVLDAEYIFGGACAAFRKSLFKQFGYFDIINKTEDIEMSMRIRFHGLKCAYAEDVVCWTEGASDIMGLINQRLRWKKGRFDTFIKYRRLFFSFEKQHNKFLSWLVLPFSLLAEIQLLFEPIAVSLLIAYSFISGDYLSLALGILFIAIIYIVNAFFSPTKSDVFLIPMFPFTWPLFYILVWIEYIALIKSLKMIIRGDDVEWQKWKRQGINNV